jgi:hypothetical protein
MLNILGTNEKLKFTSLCCTITFGFDINAAAGKFNSFTNAYRFYNIKTKWFALISFSFSIFCLTDFLHNGNTINSLDVPPVTFDWQTAGLDNPLTSKSSFQILIIRVSILSEGKEACAWLLCFSFLLSEFLMLFRCCIAICVVCFSVCLI